MGSTTDGINSIDKFDPPDGYARLAEQARKRAGTMNERCGISCGFSWRIRTAWLSNTATASSTPATERASRMRSYASLVKAAPLPSRFVGDNAKGVHPIGGHQSCPGLGRGPFFDERTA